MSEKLPKNLEEALRIITNAQHISIPLIDIRKLLLMSLITHKQGRPEFCVNVIFNPFLKVADSCKMSFTENY